MADAVNSDFSYSPNGSQSATKSQMHPTPSPHQSADEIPDVEIQETQRSPGPISDSSVLPDVAQHAPIRSALDPSIEMVEVIEILTQRCKDEAPEIKPALKSILSPLRNLILGGRHKANSIERTFSMQISEPLQFGIDTLFQQFSNELACRLTGFKEVKDLLDKLEQNVCTVVRQRLDTVEILLPSLVADIRLRKICRKSLSACGTWVFKEIRSKCHQLRLPYVEISNGEHQEKEIYTSDSRSNEATRIPDQPVVSASALPAINSQKSGDDDRATTEPEPAPETQQAWSRSKKKRMKRASKPMSSIDATGQPASVAEPFFESPESNQVHDKAPDEAIVSNAAVLTDAIMQHPFSNKDLLKNVLEVFECSFEDLPPADSQLRAVLRSRNDKFVRDCLTNSEWQARPVLDYHLQMLRALISVQSLILDEELDHKHSVSFNSSVGQDLLRIANQLRAIFLTFFNRNAAQTYAVQAHAELLGACREQMAAVLAAELSEPVHNVWQGCRPLVADTMTAFLQAAPPSLREYVTDYLQGRIQTPDLDNISLEFMSVSRIPQSVDPPRMLDSISQLTDSDILIARVMKSKLASTFHSGKRLRVEDGSSTPQLESFKALITGETDADVMDNVMRVLGSVCEGIYAESFDWLRVNMRTVLGRAVSETLAAFTSYLRCKVRHTDRSDPEKFVAQVMAVANEIVVGLAAVSRALASDSGNLLHGHFVDTAVDSVVKAIKVVRPGIQISPKPIRAVAKDSLRKRSIVENQLMNLYGSRFLRKRMLFTLSMELDIKLMPIVARYVPSFISLNASTFSGEI